MTGVIHLQGSEGGLQETQPAVFRSIGLIVIVLAITTGCSVIRATPSTTTPTGTLQGVVTGPNGPVAGASVQVTPTDNSYHQGSTDSQGFYQITGIPVGSVVVNIARSISGSGINSGGSGINILENAAQ